MFDTDFELTGKHATFTKYLVNDAKLYRRYIDVYMNGAVFGLIYHRVVSRDKESSDRARILAAAFNTCRNDCVFLYRLVMLLDDTSGLDTQQKIDRAFRDDADEEHPEKLVANMELFRSYVRGGIEEMYEQLIEAEGLGMTPDEYLEHALEMMEDFKNDLNGTNNYEDELNALL